VNRQVAAAHTSLHQFSVPLSATRRCARLLATEQLRSQELSLDPAGTAAMQGLWAELDLAPYR